MLSAQYFLPNLDPGIRIRIIIPDIPAERAGLTMDTIVRSINGFKVNEAVIVIVRISSNALGNRITIVTKLGATTRTFNIILGSSPVLP